MEILASIVIICTQGGTNYDSIESYIILNKKLVLRFLLYRKKQFGRILCTYVMLVHIEIQELTLQIAIGKYFEVSLN